MIQLVNEQIGRFKNGEILDDLCQPMIEDKTGGMPEIHDLDRIAEADQMSRSSNHPLDS